PRRDPDAHEDARPHHRAEPEQDRATESHLPAEPTVRARPPHGVPSHSSLISIDGSRDPGKGTGPRPPPEGRRSTAMLQGSMRRDAELDPRSGRPVSVPAPRLDVPR